MPEIPRQAQRETVRAIALAEMAQIAAPGARRAAEIALALPAEALARSLCALDRDLADASLRAAALATLRRYGVDARLSSARGDIPLRLLAPHDSPIPREGPLLVISNHPGLFDALALFAAAGRDDLRTLAARRPLLEALPNLSRRLLSIDPGASGGLALRHALRHLRGGGAILHFPAGRIEPDPAVAPRGDALLAPWKPGLDTLLAAAVRAVPDLHVVAAAVSGVISRRALTLARALGRAHGMTDALVPLIQLTFPGFDDAPVRVRFSAPEPAGTAARLRAVLAELVEAARGAW